MRQQEGKFKLELRYFSPTDPFWEEHHQRFDTSQAAHNEGRFQFDQVRGVLDFRVTPVER